jgi:hypothetical protein
MIIDMFSFLSFTYNSLLVYFRPFIGNTFQPQLGHLQAVQVYLILLYLTTYVQFR